MIDNEFMYMFAKRLALFVGGLGDRCHVNMVLRCHLSTITPYWSGCVVDHEVTVPLSTLYSIPCW